MDNIRFTVYLSTECVYCMYTAHLPNIHTCKYCLSVTELAMRMFITKDMLLLFTAFFYTGEYGYKND